MFLGSLVLGSIVGAGAFVASILAGLPFWSALLVWSACGTGVMLLPLIVAALLATRNGQRTTDDLALNC